MSARSWTRLPSTWHGGHITSPRGCLECHVLRGEQRREAQQRALGAQQEAFGDEVVVAGEERDVTWRRVQMRLQRQPAERVERGFLDGHDLGDGQQPVEHLRRVEHATEHRLELEQDDGHVRGVRDGLVIVDHDVRAQRLAEERADGEDEQRIRTGLAGDERVRDRRPRSTAADACHHPDAPGRRAPMTVSSTARRSSRVRCGPSPVSTLTARPRAPAAMSRST